MVRFQVLTATSVEVTVLWDVALCTVIQVDRLSDRLTASIIRAL
jgi:hypothetical protein